MSNVFFQQRFCTVARCYPKMRLAGIGLCGGEEILSALEPFHLGAGDGFFVVGVGFVFGLCFLGLVVCLLLCLGFRLCTLCSFIHKL